MRVVMVTLGTRGDVQPFVTLAKGLIGSGHEATRYLEQLSEEQR